MDKLLDNIVDYYAEEIYNAYCIDKKEAVNLFLEALQDRDIEYAIVKYIGEN